jgi:superfamily I DNA and/or RNA helicase
VAAKSREALSSNVDFLTLHHLVRQLAFQQKSELYKLQLLKELQGELSTRDEKRFLSLQRKAEMAILRNADVICTTCVGSGDPRLSKLRFCQVGLFSFCFYHARFCQSLLALPLLLNTHSLFISYLTLTSPGAGR